MKKLLLILVTTGAMLKSYGQAFTTTTFNLNFATGANQGMNTAEPTYYYYPEGGPAGSHDNIYNDHMIKVSDGVVISGFETGKMIVAKYSECGLLWQAPISNPAGVIGSAFAKDMVADAAGNIYVTGEVTVSGTNYLDLITAKVSASGVVQWVKTYNSGTGNFDSGSSLALDASNNVIVVGTKSDGSGYEKRIIAIKYFGSNGVRHMWGGILPIGESIPFDVVTDPEGNAYITGFDGHTSGIATIKLSASTGTILWNEKFIPATGASGTATKGLKINYYDNYIYVGGNTEHNANDNELRATVIKYDLSGTYIGSRSDLVTGNSRLIDLKIKNGYIYGAGGATGGMLAFKLDANLATIWTPVISSTDAGMPKSIDIDPNGNLHVLDFKRTWNFNNTINYDNYRLHKFEASTGNHPAAHVFYLTRPNQYAVDVIAYSSSTIFLTGYAQGKFYTYKYSQLTCIEEPDGITTALDEKEAMDKALHIYPNPATDKVFLNMAENKPADITLFDLQGKLILEEKGNTTGYLTVTDIHDGVYMITIHSGDQVYRKKLSISK